MAEIPVEKKSSMAWLWWLLLLAGVLALLWAIFDNDDDTPDVLQDDSVEAVETAPVVEGADADMVTADGATGAITTIAGLAGLDGRIGSTVDLETVTVNRVIGDMAFTIGTGADETLVRFDEVQTPGTPREGLIDVNPGSVVSLAGNVRELDVSDLPQSVRDDLTNENAAYIMANRINVQGGGSNPR